MGTCISFVICPALPAHKPLPLVPLVPFGAHDTEIPGQCPFAPLQHVQRVVIAMILRYGVNISILEVQSTLSSQGRKGKRHAGCSTSTYQHLWKS